MAVKRYKSTDDTFLSIVASDAAYTYASQITTSQTSPLTLVNSNSITTAGNTFIETMETQSFLLTLLYSKSNFSTTVFGNFNKIFPNTSMQLLENLTTTAQSYNKTLNNNRIITVSARYSGDIANTIVSSNLYYNTSILIFSSFVLPTFDTESVYGTTPNLIYYTMLVFNSNMTSVIQLLIDARGTKVTVFRASAATTGIVGFFTDLEPWVEHSDPFNDGGTSEPGGGGGSFDDSTDVINEPSYDPVELLNRSYGNRGFVHVYLPTQAELTSLHAFMWDNALITEMQKMFNNVVDSVISLNLIPLDFTDETPNRGNILMGLVDSEIETTIAKQQFVTLDCGTIEINEFFASYLDYSPYSKLQIYLPYIGVKDLDIDEFMNAYINVKYVIDIVSGACVAFISKSGAIDNAVVKDNPILGVLYQFAGNCALNVPISGANYAQVHAADIGAIISGAGIVGAFATGGMSAPAAVTGVLSTAANVVTSKPTISRGGSIPSTAGYMGVQKPYLILTRPRMCLPEDQNTFTGYPAYVTLTPGDTSGYTEFEEIHLENIPATDAEKDEIINLMKSGVIL